MYPSLDSDGKMPETYGKRIPYGTFAYTAGNQASAGTTSENLVAFDTEISKNRLEHSNVTQNTRITVIEAGIYWGNIRVTVNASAGGKTFNMWAKVNGSAIANSGVHESLPNSGDQLISRSYIAALNAGDYIEWAWCCRDDASLILESQPVGASPTSPASPCAVFNLARISQ